MPQRRLPETRLGKSFGAALVALLILAFFPAPPRAMAAARAASDDPQSPDAPGIPAGRAYGVTHLISDIPGFAPNQNKALVNPWGVTSDSRFCVVNNGTETARAGWPESTRGECA